MLKAFYCNRCRIRLTEPLDVRPAIEANVMRGLSKTGQDVTVRGTAYKSNRAVPWVTNQDENLMFTPQYWLNLDDLTDVVSNTRDVRRLTGCCGRSGFNGPNQICRCKAEIGTLHDDCWGLRFFIPQPAATTLRDMTGDYWNYT